MSDVFDYFVIFAEMRTGSNFLESNLSTIEPVTSFGEAFNPHFIGYPNATDVLGLTQEQRDLDPIALLERVKTYDGFGGFRFFHDHDPRVVEPILEDPRCAKIILTRNPLDSYISLKIAQETGQWKLTNVKRRKDAVVAFDAAEFSEHLNTLQSFHLKIVQGLQKRGQTPFFISYDDLQDIGVLNGLAKWLGQTQPIAALDDKLKRQNPAPAASKVSNPDEMAKQLAELDPFQLARTPNLEPRRGPNVRSYIAGAHSPLLFLPISGAPVEEICDWMAATDRASPDQLVRLEGQKHLRQWMNQHPGHRSFTVVRHPLARAFHVFQQVVLAGDGQLSKRLRQILQRQFDVSLPAPGSTDPGLYAAAFAGFLEFLKQNLSGHSPLRVDARWASQSQILSGFEEFCAPDFILREDELSGDLSFVARKAGCAAATYASAPTAGVSLSDIYDTDLEARARAAYRRDYMVFGFGDWTPAR